MAVGRPIGNNAINETIEVMTFTALFRENKEVVLHTRVAGANEAIYYDLADKDWNIIRIAPSGWAVTNKLPPMFRRFSHQVAQVLPQSDPVAALTLALMSVRSEWRGSAASLLAELRKIAPENGVNVTVKSFPPDATRLSKRLNGIKSNLEAAGITFERYKSNGVVGIRFTMKKEE